LSSGRNLARDPRIALSVFDLANPYRTVEIRGHAELIEDPDHSLSLTLSQRYLGEDPPAEGPEVVRLKVRIVPEKVITFAA
jgi:hypothetical protein